MEVLDSFPFRVDPAEVMTRLRNRGELEGAVRDLVTEVQRIARPKAVYDVCYVDEKGSDWVVVNGVRFKSHVLRVNLDPVNRIFPYIATCGTEVEAITVPEDDIVTAYCLDTIKRSLVTAARTHLEAYLSKRYAVSQFSRMGPGSLTDWPITEQQPLFSLFGNVENLIGVKLTENCLMVPVKSVSGIMFPTEVKFENCQLCPRPVCEGRRAPYDPALAEEYRQRVLA
jgi:hypothetical protein